MENNLEKLKEPLPPEAISRHPTKTYLSSIKAIYVTERFNDVFGVGKWTIKTEEIKVNLETGMVVVKATFEVPELKIYYESFGGNDNGGTNNKNFDLGDAYKGATTDAITKIGSYLGVGIAVFKGLPQSPQAPHAPKTAPVASYTPQNKQELPKPVQGSTCAKCGAEIVRNPKTDKMFCKDKCWLKKPQAQPQEDLNQFDPEPNQTYQDHLDEIK